MTAQRYPLSWPTGWRRTGAGDRKTSTFGTKRPGEMKRAMTVASATSRLLGELRKLGVDDGDAIMSTNLRVRLDGLPAADQRAPEDVGVALYFRLKGQDRVLACDRWRTVADNITAIAMHVEAIRAIERYGVGSLEQAFAGYVGLPAKGHTWRTTLGFAVDQVVSAADVDAAFRQRAATAHPDKGGSHDAMASLTQARSEALQELRQQ